MRLRLATWNVNSVRVRMDHIARFVAETRPDVLCLQETKVEDDKFPRQPFYELGFAHHAVAGQKGYHGVAVFSKQPIEGVERIDWAGLGESRHLCVRLAPDVVLHNFYVPAGGDIPDPELNDKFAQKLAFLDHMTQAFGHQRRALDGRRMILLGDLNVAPLECDVWSHARLVNVVSHTPVEVARLERLQQSCGWVDVMRRLVPAPERLYTWWSYRARDWRAADRGRRLDHVWVTPALSPAVQAMAVHEHTRDWTRPSDHVPVTVDFVFDGV